MISSLSLGFKGLGLGGLEFRVRAYSMVAFGAFARALSFGLSAPNPGLAQHLFQFRVLSRPGLYTLKARHPQTLNP